MLMHEERNSNDIVIKHYQPGSITINETSYHKSLILTANSIIEHWRPQTITQLQAEDFEILLDKGFEVVLIGTGSKQHFPATSVFSLLINANLGYEVMDTAAACRTFNLLVSEGRRVAAALIIG
jgi:uncharacterized protein